jgi:hypothetical protein
MGARGVGVIRVDEVWMAAQPLNMRMGNEAALARVPHSLVAPLAQNPNSPKLGCACN